MDQRLRKRLSQMLPSLLGSSLADRVRSTTVALLALPALAGLATIAIVLNQSLPFVPGSPLPQVEPQRATLGKGRIAADGSGHRAARSGRVSEDVGLPLEDTGSGGRAGGESAAPTGGTPDGTPQLVVAPSKPATSGGGRSGSGGNGGAPAGGAAPQGASGPGSGSSPSSPSSPPPPPAAEPPEAEISEAPESSLPPWSSGKGHGYGREKDTAKGPPER